MRYQTNVWQDVCKFVCLYSNSILIFRSGKIVCTGARNEHDSYIAARKFARIIQKLGFPVSIFTLYTHVLWL